MGYIQCSILVVCSGIATEKAASPLSNTLIIYLFLITLYWGIIVFKICISLPKEGSNQHVINNEQSYMIYSYTGVNFDICYSVNNKTLLT